MTLTAEEPRARAGRTYLADALGLVGSTLGAWALLAYLHGRAPEWTTALACGALSGVVLRRFVRSAYAHFPIFLTRLFDAGSVAIGTVVCTLATLTLHPLAYLGPRLPEAGVLCAAAALLGLGLGALVHTHTRFGLLIGAAKEREAALREEALRARLRALQAQIHPHFLFNALNSLAELTHDDPDAAERMVADIAHLLRYSLKTSAAERVSLEQELEATDRYLGVERARLGDRLRVERDVDAALTAVTVPGLIVQPLVENAVRHAVAARSAGGAVAITVAAAGANAVRITVEDDGPGLPEATRRALVDGEARGAGTGGAGGGLGNVARRLELAYRGAARLEIDRGPRGGARIAIEVPR